MATSDPEIQVGPRLPDVAQLILTAVAAVAIALASQGWPWPDAGCDTRSCASSVGEEG